MSFWTDRRVAVTGATGFVGTALVAALRARGGAVTRVRRPGTVPAAGDVAAAIDDPDALAAAFDGVDTVFHLAGAAIADGRDAAGAFAVNVGGTWGVLEGVRQAGVRRTVLVSSGKVYGKGASNGHAVGEDAPLAGTGAYAVSKIAAERLALAYAHAHGLSIGIVRPANLFGAGDAHASRLVPGTLAAIAAGEPPVIRGSGRDAHDWLHVDDAVAAMLALAERLHWSSVAGRAYNISSGGTVPVAVLVDMLAAAAGRPDLAPLVLGNRGGAAPVDQPLDNTRVEELLGWHPAADLATRLAETARGSASMPPRILIGIPTLDRPELVRHTLESVLAQGVRDMAVVVSDNVSRPETRAAVRAHVEALGDPRVRFVEQPANGGEYGQGRFLFAEAKRLGADYFAILHDDDLLEPGYVARALAALDAAPDAALFVANPRLIDRDGADDPARTRRYLADHGRNARERGRFDVLDAHLATGFTPISGTVLRTAACADAGFTDEDCAGNFPFELNVMLRLGDAGAVGWFEPDPLIAFRFHDASLRVTLRLMNNPAVVRTMLTLFRRRHYRGRNEARRRVLVSRLERADALLRLDEGDVPGCRAALARACAARPRSLKAWALRGAVRLAPGATRRHFAGTATHRHFVAGAAA